MGEIENVYYIPEIGSQLISIGKLLSQGWEPQLSHFALHDKEGRLVLFVPKKDNTYSITMQAIHPNLSLSAHEDNGKEATDKQLHEHLELICKSPLVASMTGEGHIVRCISLDYRRKGRIKVVEYWHQNEGILEEPESVIAGG